MTRLAIFDYFLLFLFLFGGCLVLFSNTSLDTVSNIFILITEKRRNFTLGRVFSFVSSIY